MLLEAENKNPVRVADFSTVERVLRGLKSHGKTSFASLTKDDGSFVQVAGGRVTCILERRAKGSSDIQRAFLFDVKSPFKGTQTLVCGAGHIEHQPDEGLFIDDVIACFRAFFKGWDFPSEIGWRVHVKVT
ncbi:hypothetical protein [Pacificoceanicola onchidii]|uniref:hypothetical protein n=1 Tax=Pacificoceanicola onchidii TaxID=2562685 RepID=UPI0010A5E885|nr:hypothetical protein [Pacificoceanicola onchidii]